MKLTKNKLDIALATILSFSSIGVGIIATLFYTPFLLDVVGDNQYGINSFVTSLTSWLTVITIGIANSFVRFSAKVSHEDPINGQKEVNTAFLVILSITALISAMIGSLFFTLLKIGKINLTNYSLSEMSILTNILFIEVVGLIFSFVTIFFNSYNTSKHKLTFVRGVALAITILNPLISFPLLFKHPNIITISLVKTTINFVVMIVYVLYSIFVTKVEFAPLKSFDFKRLIKDILIFSFYSMLLITFKTFNKSIDKVILGVFVGPYAVTLYQIALGFVEYFYQGALHVTGNFNPKVTKYVVEGNTKAIQKYFITLSRVSLILLFFIFGGFVVAGRTFVTNWVGESRIEAYYISILLILINIVPFSEIIADIITKAMNKHKFPAILLVINLISNLIITLILVIFVPKEYAILACIIGTLLTTVICQWIILNIYYKKLGLDVNKFFLNFLKYLGLSVFCILVSMLINFLLLEKMYFLKGWLLTLAQAITFVLFYVTIIALFDYTKIKHFLSKSNS